jgi:hypothetical protein
MIKADFFGQNDEEILRDRIYFFLGGLVAVVFFTSMVVFIFLQILSILQ